MIENISPKGVSFSDLICIFAMSYQSFACLFLQHKDKWILRHGKITGNFLLLRYLKGLIYNSVAELRKKKYLTIRSLYKQNKKNFQ